MRKISRINSRIDEIKVRYNDAHWIHLEKLRFKGRKIMSMLHDHGIEAALHGSVARGDISKDSDIDIAVIELVSPSIIETVLELSKHEVDYKAIIQATPLNTPKLYYHLRCGVILSLPFGKLSKLEREFYKFSGEISYRELCSDIRVPGVNKKLRLIIPASFGHIEKSVIGREIEVARLLKVSLDIVNERVRMLTKRRSMGRTGVFIKRILAPNESINNIIEEIMRKNPAFRKKVSKYL